MLLASANASSRMAQQLTAAAADPCVAVHSCIQSLRHEGSEEGVQWGAQLQHLLGALQGGHDDDFVLDACDADEAAEGVVALLGRPAGRQRQR